MTRRWLRVLRQEGSRVTASDGLNRRVVFASHEQLAIGERYSVAVAS